MADGGCNNGAENVVVELEAMRKGTFSWHPCQVSPCSRGSGLVVQYEDGHPEEVIADKDEILTRIRVRSTPFQSYDCSSLQQGNRVLAAQSSDDKGVFCDALVEKTVRVRHSRRAHCRCSFTVKWVHQPLEEKDKAMTVPISAIMKLSTKSISLHPTISTFFGMLESPNGVDTSLCSKIVDNLNWEMDINLLLEKQIEEISNSTDLSLKKISKNFVFGLKVDLKGKGQGNTFDASSKKPHVIIPLKNNLRGYNPSTNKQPRETKDETPSISVSSIQEGTNGSKLPLNPLAARAALASLRSELSVQSNVDKGNIKSVTDDIPLSVSAALGPQSPNFEGIVKTLFPISSAPTSKGKKNKISVKKITMPSETRLTRSRIQKNNNECFLGKDETSDNVDSEEVTFAKDAEKHNYSRRRTRSAAREETEENNVQSGSKVRKSNFSETNEVDLFKGDASTNSKRAKTTPKTPEGVACNNSQDTKKRTASSMKPDTRFSPRLRSLPRTRSQTKA